MNKEEMPTIQEVSTNLLDIKSLVGTYLQEDRELKVRLQVYPSGEWMVVNDDDLEMPYTYRGVGSLTRRTDCRVLACDLLKEVYEDMVQKTEGKNDEDTNKKE